MRKIDLSCYFTGLKICSSIASVSCALLAGFNFSESGGLGLYGIYFIAALALFVLESHVMQKIWNSSCVHRPPAAWYLVPCICFALAFAPMAVFSGFLFSMSLILIAAVKIVSILMAVCTLYVMVTFYMRPSIKPSL